MNYKNKSINDEQNRIKETAVQAENSKNINILDDFPSFLLFVFITVEIC